MEHHFIDRYSHSGSFLNRLDPRIKTLLFLVIMICILTTPSNVGNSFALYFALILSLTLLSGIPPLAAARRSLVILPFLTMTAFFIFFSSGPGGGAKPWGVMLIKSWLSCLCLILLVMSSRFANLLKALEQLHCPKLIVMILSFMYRYIFVIQDELLMMNRAKASRGGRAGRRSHFRILANMVGVLFIRSYERAEAIYMAMAARGFCGTVQLMQPERPKKSDIAFGVSLAMLAVAIRLG